MEKLPKIIDHTNINDITVKDLNELNPDTISVELIKKTAGALNKALARDGVDLYKVCVNARQAMNVAAEMIRVISRMQQYYKTKTKQMYSIAKIDKAEEWFEEHKPNIKITDGMRSTYADMDEQYILFKEKENSTTALLEYLRNKFSDFEHDLNLAKKKMSVDADESKYAGYMKESGNE